MICDHLQKIWDEHAPAEHKAHSPQHGRLQTVHLGHRDAEGNVTLHDTPWQTVRCNGCPELIKLPFIARPE